MSFFVERWDFKEIVHFKINSVIIYLTFLKRRYKCFSTVFVHTVKDNGDVHQNVFFCAPRKKVNHTGLEQNEGY